MSSPNVPTRWRLAVRDDLSLDSKCKLVAYVLSTYMDNKDGGAWPSREKLAKGSSLSIRTVDAALRGLEEAGYLIGPTRRRIVDKNGNVVERRPGGRWFTNLFVAALPKQRSGCALTEGETAQPATPNSATDDAKQRSVCARTIEELSTELPTGSPTLSPGVISGEKPRSFPFVVTYVQDGVRKTEARYATREKAERIAEAMRQSWTHVTDIAVIEQVKAGKDEDKEAA